MGPKDNRKLEVSVVSKPLDNLVFINIVFILQIDRDKVSIKAGDNLLFAERVKETVNRPQCSSC